MQKNLHRNYKVSIFVMQLKGKEAFYQSQLKMYIMKNLWFGWGNMSIYQKNNEIFIPIWGRNGGMEASIPQKSLSHLGREISIGNACYLHIENPVDGMIVCISSPQNDVYVKLNSGEYKTTEVASNSMGATYQVDGLEVSEECFEHWLLRLMHQEPES